MTHLPRRWTLLCGLALTLMLAACDRSAPDLNPQPTVSAPTVGTLPSSGATTLATAAAGTAIPAGTRPVATPTTAATGPTAAATRPAAPTTAPTAVPTVAPTVAPAAVTPAGTALNMRTVDWMHVVTTDPNLNYDPSITQAPGLQSGPWVQLKSNTEVQGYAVVDPDRILFVDISGDGQEEAIISLYSGGTAGDLGLLVYTAANGTPVLADSLGGYKLGGGADGARLKVTEPIYQGWEPNCCPSGFIVTRYKLAGGKLAQVSRDEQPIPEARKMTVDKFYELLQARNYADAYNNFMSAAYHADHPFGAWSAGYANTLSFTVTTSDNADGSVKVDLIAHNKSGSGEVVKHYRGAWRLRWVSTARFKQWVLDSASFVELP